ncbi:MAG TPA: ABC transporter permease [Terriglobia bacterium]|nr:ABC transporter permease [Terriglobia bacterium]
MIRGEVWKIAIDALRADKVKAFLTMLGVVIGSACIVLVVTVSLIGRNYILAQIEGVGSNIVYGELIRTGSQSTTLSDEITLSNLEAVRDTVPSVVRVAGTHDLQMSVVAAGVERPVTLVAVTPEFQAIRNLLVTRGRYFDGDDMKSRSKVCLLTEELARIVFPGVNPVGMEIRVGELRFTIIGVFKERVATFGQSEIARESVIVPFGLLKSYAGTDTVKVLYAQAATPESVPAVTKQIEQLLRSRHRAGAVYNIQNLTAILDAAQNISLAVSLVLLAVGSVTLIISGVGIMNIMLVTVTERTREIGVRKAIGAPKREILYQFLIEALIISIAGATLGIAIALAIPVIARPFLPEGMIIPISPISIVAAFLVSCSTGMIFGYLPASRAAKLQPTEALRYE